MNTHQGSGAASRDPVRRQLCCMSFKGWRANCRRSTMRPWDDLTANATGFLDRRFAAVEPALCLFQNPVAKEVVPQI